MTDRSTETTVTFRHVFRLSALDRPQPAGTYTVVTDEEEIPGLSYVAFRRTATLLHLPAVGTSRTHAEVVCIDPLELTAALIADRVTKGL
jgi:hypothetical protein